MRCVMDGRMAIDSVTRVHVCVKSIVCTCTDIGIMCLHVCVRLLESDVSTFYTYLYDIDLERYSHFKQLKSTSFCYEKVYF